MLHETKNLLTSLNDDISSYLGTNFHGSFQESLMSGGGGASVGTIYDSSLKKGFFYKSSGLLGFNMLQAEYLGIKEMFETNTIRVPEPISCGTSSCNSYVIFEKLSLGGNGNPEIYGKKLAAMHQHISKNNQFGFHINNTIGATPQLNNWESNWADFYDKYRLEYMISLAKYNGFPISRENQLREKVYNILSKHNCVPSLVHGDLWSGNQAYTKEGDPVIFDPSTYYGDREVDIAMTKLFGLNSKKFYDAYDEVWMRPRGWEIRELIYNLYHILNHYVLFGGSYANQANRMIDQILSYPS
jgi:fructosamine-3-kinase